MMLGELEYRANGQSVILRIDSITAQAPGFVIVASGNIKRKQIRALRHGPTTLILRNAAGMALFSKVVDNINWLDEAYRFHANHITACQPIGLA